MLSLSTSSSLLLATLLLKTSAAPMPDPVAEPHYPHPHPPPETFTIVFTPPATGTDFPSLTSTQGGFTGVPTGIGGSSSCVPTFSVMGTATDVTTVRTTRGSITSNTAFIIATKTTTTGNPALGGNAAASATLTPKLGVMTTSGTYSGVWTIPAGCTIPGPESTDMASKVNTNTNTGSNTATLTGTSTSPTSTSVATAVTTT